MHSGQRSLHRASSTIEGSSSRQAAAIFIARLSLLCSFSSPFTTLPTHRFHLKPPSNQPKKETRPAPMPQLRARSHPYRTICVVCLLAVCPVRIEPLLPSLTSISSAHLVAERVPLPSPARQFARLVLPCCSASLLCSLWSVPLASAALSPPTLPQINTAPLSNNRSTAQTGTRIRPQRATAQRATQEIARVVDRSGRTMRAYTQKTKQRHSLSAIHSTHLAKFCFQIPP